MSSPFPPIPDPGGDLASLAACVRTMRQTLQLLTAAALPDGSKLSTGAKVYALKEDVAGVTKNFNQQVITLRALVAAKWAVKVDVDGNVAGIELIGTGESSAFNILADQFNITLPGYSPVPVMSVAEVDGVPTLAFDGNIIADGTVLNPGIGENAVSNSAGQNSSGGEASVLLDVRAGSRIGIIAGFGGNGGTAAPNGSLSLYIGSDEVASQNIPGVQNVSWVWSGTAWIPTVSGNSLHPSTLVYAHTAAEDGTLDITVEALDDSPAQQGPTSILAFELSR
jgi:hypothetical protein